MLNRTILHLATNQIESLIRKIIQSINWFLLILKIDERKKYARDCEKTWLI